MIFDQAEFELRCEWGEPGVLHLAPISDVVIIVDVLSFSTCVEIATSRGAVVFPYRWQDESAIAYAQSIDATLAAPRQSQGNWENSDSSYSLSPTSLLAIASGTRLVLPSPNGSTLSLLGRQRVTLAGCLRNCQAVAALAQRIGSKIAVIPAGERWQDGSLRLAWEDWVAAGAILSYLKGARSPETQAAIAAFDQAKDQLEQFLKQCGSGKELIARGFSRDVELASFLNTSHCVPRLLDGAYCRIPVKGSEELSGDVRSQPQP